MSRLSELQQGEPGTGSGDENTFHMQRGLNVGEQRTAGCGQQLWNGTSTTRSTALERMGRHVCVSVDVLEMLEQVEV